MTKKKLKLKDLKVKSFVTKLDKKEQQTAKGGIISSAGKLTGGDYWTAVKTQYKGTVIISK